MRSRTDENKRKSALTEKQARSLPSLIGSRTITEGCKKANISRDVFYLWMRQPDFREAYRAQSTELVNQALNGLKLLADRSVQVLGKLLTAKSEGIRFRTAMGIIETLIAALEREEIESRIEALEQAILKEENNQ